MPASEQWRRTREKILAACFALVAGYTDAITILRWRCFTTMMTGNVLFLGRSLALNQLWIGWDWILYHVLIINFALGVVVYKLAERRWPNRGASTVGFLFGAVMFSGELVYMHLRDEGWGHRWLAAGLSPMYGMLMAACTNGKLHAATTMLTGHIVTLAMVAAERLVQKEPLSKSTLHKAALSGWVIFSLFVGAGTGSLASILTKQSAEGLLLPVPPILALLLWFYDHIAKPRSLVKNVQRRVRDRRNARRQRTDDADSDDGCSTIDSDSACDEDDLALASPQASGGAPAEDEARDLEGGDGAASSGVAQAAAGGGSGIAGAGVLRLEAAHSGELVGHRDELAVARARGKSAAAHGPGEVAA